MRITDRHNMISAVGLLNFVMFFFFLFLFLSKTNMLSFLVCVECTWSVLVIAVSISSLLLGDIAFLYLGLLVVCLSTVELVIGLSVFLLTRDS